MGDGERGGRGRGGEEGEETGEEDVVTVYVCAFPRIDACHVPTTMIINPFIHSSLPHLPSQQQQSPHNQNRDALGRKVEADVEAKTDFNALKNQWDSIEKDFHTWSKEVSRGGTGRNEGTRKGGDFWPWPSSSISSFADMRDTHPSIPPSPFFIRSLPSTGPSTRAALRPPALWTS
jgi:hypothetical protein